LREVPRRAADDRWPFAYGYFFAVVPADAGDMPAPQLAAHGRLRPRLTFSCPDSPAVEINRYRVWRLALGEPLEYLAHYRGLSRYGLHSITGIPVGARTVRHAAFGALLLLVFHAA